VKLDTTYGAASQPPRVWDLGINVEPWDEGAFETVIATGFRYVFIDLYPWDDEEKLRRGYAQVGRFRDRLIPWSIHLPFLLNSWDFDLDALTREYLASIEKSAPFGVKRAAIHARLWPIPEPPAAPLESTIRRYEDRVVELLAACCRAAAAHGITIGLENDMWHEQVGMWLATAPDLVRLVERIGEPNVGVCLDANHASGSGVNPGRFIREAGSRLVDTHLNDTFGYFQGRSIAECDMHLPPGVGAINWCEVLDALHAIEYPNPVVFEVDPAALVSEGWPSDQQNAYPYRMTYAEWVRLCYQNWRTMELARWAWDHVPKWQGAEMGKRHGLSADPQALARG